MEKSKKIIRSYHRYMPHTRSTFRSRHKKTRRSEKRRSQKMVSSNRRYSGVQDPGLPFLDRFFKTFGEEHPLTQELYSYLYATVQDKTCLDRQAVGAPADTLEDVLCDFSFAYVPIPLGEELKKHRTLLEGKVINQGKNGKVVDSGTFDDRHIVTKIELRPGTVNTKEIYMNMVVVNEFLRYSLLTRSLVPTYGIFACPVQGNQYCTETGPDQLFMVQKLVTGHTLNQYLKSEGFTLSHLMEILKTVSYTLMIIELSDYHVVHHDLHGGNILVSSSNVYIVDWGLSSVSVGEGRFTNEHEDRYDTTTTYHGAAYDGMMLLWTILSRSINPEIIDKAIEWRDRLMGALKLTWEYRESYWLYHWLQEDEDKYADAYDGGQLDEYAWTPYELHKWRVRQLKNMTYQRLFRDVFGLDNAQDDYYEKFIRGPFEAEYPELYAGVPPDDQVSGMYM